MSEIRAAARVALRSTKNSVRHETRWRVGVLVALAFDLVVATVGMNSLAARVVEWQKLGPPVLQSQLWLLGLTTWGGIVLVTLLGSLQLAFRNNILRLLVTQPLSHASLFRLQYVWVLVGNGNWLLLALAVAGIPLLVTLGPAAGAWIPLLVAGELLAVWFGFLLPLLFIRIVAPHRNATLFMLVATGIGLLMVGQLGWLPGLAVGGMHRLSTPSPASGFGVFVVALLLALGPLAGLWGRLQLAVFQIAESRRGQRSATRVPGIRLITRGLLRYRTVTAALAVKGLWSQTRNPLLWARLAALLIYYAVFPFIHRYLLPYHIPDLLFVVAYASGLAVLTVVDAAPSPVGGEGNRLALYLVAPLKPMEILFAKWIALLAPIIVLGWVMTIALALSLGLSAGATAFAGFIVSLLVVGSTALVIGGSVWDVDLDQRVEGAMQTFLQEEAPVSPQRLLTVGLSLLFWALALGVAWMLSADFVLPVLVLLDCLVIIVVEHLASTRWSQLV